MKTSAWRSVRFVAACGIALLLLVLTGCVSERTAGSDTHFTYEWWVPTLMFVGGVAATAGGWFARGANDRWPYALLIGGPILFIFMAPTYFFSKASLNADELKVKGGIWGMSSNQTVKYENLQEIRFATTVTTGRRGRKNTNHFIDCKCKSGEDIRLALSHDCVKEAAPQFLALAAARKIPVFDEDGTAIDFNQE